ncbi:ZIP family metal transporter [Patescibacteria group bacterium]|nr:ZIP family metal transporter [Patescibacteria group bacterium]
MTQPWLYTILSVLAVSLVSLIGILALSINQIRLKKILLLLVSFAAGSLLGGAFIHLLPEAFAESEITEIIPFIILLGIVFFFFLEKILCWRHCHIPTSDEHPHPLGINNLVGDGFHNLIDGMIIAGAYMVSVPVGIATTVAVLLHEIPQEIGDFGVLLHAGYTKKKAIFFNFLSALAAVVGAVLTLIIGSSVEHAQEYLIPFTIGGFIYIATADLIPELKKETNLGKSLLQLIALLLGIGVMSLLLLLE